ncbi:MAG: hypothetical protein SFT94_09705 [Pseudanabaenaceae cyanobacterium bins.68]|nr:hypothetical protein [Pseudanabaenaceae cyanobacterium bins.68]
MAQFNNIIEKLSQSGQQLGISLRLSLIKLLNWLITEFSPGADNSQGRSLLDQTRWQLVKGASYLQAKLKPTTAELQQPVLPEPVQQELSVAWHFVQTQLVPRLIGGFSWLLDWLDPKVASLWQKFTALAPVQNLSRQVGQTSAWQKLMVAIAPLARSLSQVEWPSRIQPWRTKPAALWTVGITLVLFFWLKPSHAVVAQNPTLRPVATNLVETLDQVLPPELGDQAISPEQIMVTDIQAQVAEVSNRYGEALIQSVQTNFKLGRLVIQMTDAWYQLSPNRQEQLLADLLDRAQGLKFKKLIIADQSKALVARSPVVGNQMVVLRR